MISLATWLAGLQLEQYADVLASNGVDVASLRLLSDEDLAGLGMLLGHRRRLLKAITSLEMQETHEAQAKPIPPQPSSRAPGERRRITVLFCDLVDSTGLAQRLDPEELRELMRAYQSLCGRIVARYSGCVAQYLGDGMVIYFGFPQAHEDDAERAVRAALEIVLQIAQARTSDPLRVHIGVATGAVVVGETDRNDPSSCDAAVGATPSLAARLCALAAPGQILIAPDTRGLLGATFRLDDLGEHTFKGFDAPVRVARVAGFARSTSRFRAIRSDRSTPFVGRELEVGLMFARWQTAREGEGQVVVLAGEPGIGKSRIAHELSELLRGESHLMLRYQCSPFQADSSFHPIIEQVSAACGFDRCDSPDVKLDRLEHTLLLEPGELDEVAPLDAILLSLPIARYAPRMVSPQRMREATIDALIEQPLRLSLKQPLLMIFEDAQWADPDTLETMALFIERIRHRAILLLVTCRPELTPPWTAHGHVTLLHLNRLAKRQGARIVVELTAAKPLPADVLDQILERADGVPLFVEELTHAVIEAGFMRDADDHWELLGPHVPHAIPVTLHDSLMARLDRLAPVKAVAQVGACFGREFDYRLLAAIASVDKTRLDDALRELEASGLIFRRGPTYRFKHALVRDVAYDSLLRRQRLEIHASIARALATQFSDRAKESPEMLALHLTRAGMIDRALPQWQTAARSAVGRNQHREALRHVESGLALIGQADAAGRADHEVALLVTGASCHWALEGYACPAAAGYWARAEALLDVVTQERLLVLALVGIVICAYAAADTRKSLAMAERVIALADRSSDIDSKLVAYSACGPILHQQGQFERCKALLQYVLDTYAEDRFTGYGRANDPKVSACSWLSYCYLETGHFDEARRFAEIAIDHAAKLARPFVLAQALSVSARAFAEAGDVAATHLLCLRCIDLCDAQFMPFWKGWAMAYDGVALEWEGRHEDAEARLAQAIAHLFEHGGRNDVGYIRAWRAQSLAYLGRFDEARREIAIAREDSVRTGQPLCIVLLTYVDGLVEALDPHGSLDCAAGRLRSAARDGRVMRIPLLELRATVALAFVMRDQGRGGEAYALLGPLIECFTEGRDCAQMIEARAVLASCRPAA